MCAYAEAYLQDVVENQGKLFDYVAQTFPDKDTEDFINTYMVRQESVLMKQKRMLIQWMRKNCGNIF